MRSRMLLVNDKYHLILFLSSTIFLAFAFALPLHYFTFSPIHDETPAIIAAAIYTVLGTIYGVLVAFTIMGVWENYYKAEDSVQKDAFSLLNLVQVVEAQFLTKMYNIRQDALEYLNLVVAEEWQTLKHITNNVVTSHELSRQACFKIMHKIQILQPKNEPEYVVFSHALTLLVEWLDARRTRILAARGNNAKALWPLLLTGAIMLFSFHGLLPTELNLLWFLFLLMIAIIIGLAFYLIFELDCPFAGQFAIDSQSFQWAISALYSEKKTEAPNL